LELQLNIPTMATGVGRECAFIDRRSALFVCDLDFNIVITTRSQRVRQVLQKARRAIQVEPFPSLSRIDILFSERIDLRDLCTAMTPPQTLDNRQYKCNRAANSKALNSPHLLQKQVPNILKCRNVRGNESEREEGLACGADQNEPRSRPFTKSSSPDAGQKKRN
jgi:hypothetical protein